MVDYFTTTLSKHALLHYIEWSPKATASKGIGKNSRNTALHVFPVCLFVLGLHVSVLLTNLIDPLDPDRQSFPDNIILFDFF